MKDLSDRIDCLTKIDFKITPLTMITNIINKFKAKLILTTVISAFSSIISIFLLAEINGKIGVSDIHIISQAIPYFLFMVFGLFVVSFLSQYFLAKIGTAFVYELRTSLLQQVSKIDYQQLEKIGGHRVLATITTDVSNVSQALAVLPVFVVNLATVLFCFSYLFIQSAALFSVLILSLLIGVGSSVFIMKVGGKYFVELREKEDNLFSVFKTLVDGSKELNINQYRRNYFYNQQAQPCIEEVQLTEIKAKAYWIFSESLLRSLIFLILGLIIYSAHVFYQTETAVLSGFILFTTYIIGPLNFLQSTFQFLSKGKVAYNKIISLNLENKEIVFNDNTTDKLTEWKQLTLKQISYVYQDSDSYKFSMGPIDMEIFQGETIFICGGNGSGKSTFAKVLVGLYNISSGCIKLSDTEVTTSNLQWYRNHFSTIFSDFHLFDYVLDADGNPVNHEKVSKHLQKLQLDHKVEVVNGKISSTNLSQGERKRLAMLLVYMEDSSIYLFDEWAADQDPVFRKYFYHELLPELKTEGKTLIVITHDDKYFDLSDRLIKFDNGQMAEITDNKGQVFF